MKKLITTLSLLLGMSFNAFALDKEAFDKERFEQLQAENQVILVDVFATWCSTCAKQQEQLKQYRQQNPDKQFVILEVDFDTDKQWVTHFRAPRQSTLILYQGDERVWFSVAETRYESIANALDEALGETF